jgi:mono/diheme cytochrome c family protein
MIRAITLALLGVLPAGVVASALPATSLADLLAEGERYWTTSPVRGDPVACATCHHDPDETRRWAASFPKYRALRPPDGRVMTLLQANAEAVRRHYELRDPERAAVAITAYLTSRGADVPVTPGMVEAEPVFEPRRQALAASVARGERLYARRCGGCHAAATVASGLTRFPRVVDGQAQSLERFVARHGLGLPRSGWNSAPIADVIAFLMSHLVGHPVGGRPETAAVPSMGLP